MWKKILTLVGLKPRTTDVVFARPPLNEQELQAGLTAAVAKRAGLDATGLDPERTFAQLGFDSLQAMKFTGHLEKDLGLELDPTLMWDHPTVARLTAYLTERLDFSAGRRSIA